ncbi:MAG: histidine phosphatase family protein, partial [Turicibacter sp.]
MNLTTLCMIRHGETDWNLSGRFQGREDIELNETGRQQARGCIDFLKEEKWDRIISSPLKRAKETAQIMGSALLLPEVEVFQDLIEMDFGSAAGLLPEERGSLFPDGQIHDQELREQVIHRVLAELNLIDKTYPNERIILVTHGMVI